MVKDFLTIGKGRGFDPKEMTAFLSHTELVFSRPSPTTTPFRVMGVFFPLGGLSLSFPSGSIPEKNASTATAQPRRAFLQVGSAS